MTDDFIYPQTQADFTDTILDTARRRDGSFLSSLLSASNMCNIHDLDFDDCFEPNLDQPAGNDLYGLWRLISQHHWTVIRYLQTNDIDRAFRHQSKKFSCFMTILSIYSNRLVTLMHSDDGNDVDQLHQLGDDDDPSWLLPVFNRLGHELRLIALLEYDGTNNEDGELADTGNSNTMIQVCITQLLNAFNPVQRLPISVKFKKVGTFIIANHILKAYYALNQFNLCKPVISKSERPLREYINEENAQPEIQYSSYVLTYRYFLGKNLLLQHKYSLAAEHFEYVFTNCLDSNQCFSMKNKQRSLLHLAVLKMLHGATPNMEILRKYELNELIDILEPVRTGSLELFMDRVKQHERYLFDCGLYFLIENFKLIGIRNLFRIYVNRIDPDRTNRIALETALFILNFGFGNNNTFTMNDLIDILNNMIEKRIIRCYISYKHQTLVFSAKDAFPKTFQFSSLFDAS